MMRRLLRLAFAAAALSASAIVACAGDPPANIEQNPTTGVVSIRPPCATLSACLAAAPVTIGTTAGSIFRPLGVVPSVATTAALAARLSFVGETVLKVGYTTVGDMPPTAYTLASGTCPLNAGAGDGGSQIASGVSSSCWILSIPATFDARIWGAKANATKINQVMTTTSGSSTVSIPTASFVSGDVGKYITFTNSPVGAGFAPPTYQGTITSVTDATHVTVSPTPSFSLSTVKQYIAYGNDDSAAINATLTYAASLQQYAGDMIPVSLNGLSYGVTAPIFVPAGTELSHGSPVVLSSAGFSCSTAAVTINTANASTSWLSIDSNYLPVNGWLSTTNGVTSAYQTWVRHWRGACTTTPVTVTTTTGSYVVGLASASAVSTFMVSHGNTAVGIPDLAAVMKVYTNTADANSPCFGAQCMVISKPATASASAQAATLSTDVSGETSFGSASGVHFLSSGAKEYDSLDPAHMTTNDHTGCAFFHQGNQTDLVRYYGEGGVSPLCFDSSSNGVFVSETHLYNTNFSGTDGTNAPTTLIASGADDTKFESGAFGGVFLAFLLEQTGNPPTIEIGGSISLNNLTASPNAHVQIVGMGNVASTLLNVAPYGSFSASMNLLNISGISKTTGAIGTCGTDWTFTSLSCTAIAKINTLSGGVMLPTRNALSTNGLDLLGGAITDGVSNMTRDWAQATTSIDLSTTAAQPSSRYFYLNNGTTAVTVTLPNNRPRGTSFAVWQQGSATVTYQGASGTYVNGTVAGSKTGTTLKETLIECIRNDDGVSSQWMVTVLP